MTPETNEPFDPSEQLAALREIRGMMEESTRFISVSGLSVICAGVSALIGAAVAYYYLGMGLFDTSYFANITKTWRFSDYNAAMTFFILDAAAVFLVASLAAFWFTWLRSKHLGQGIFGPTSLRLMVNFAFPLGVGGLFCWGMLLHGYIGMIAPSMLLFFGLALVNSSKYTFQSIRVLGIWECFLGLIGSFYFGYGLMLWVLGFGLSLVVYGLYLYFQNERAK